MKTKQELTQFVKFPFSLYDKSSNWVPPLINDELESMDPEKNPVFKNAEARFFLAFKGKKPGILHWGVNISIFWSPNPGSGVLKPPKIACGALFPL